MTTNGVIRLDTTHVCLCVPFINTAYKTVEIVKTTWSINYIRNPACVWCCCPLFIYRNQEHGSQKCSLDSLAWKIKITLTHAILERRHDLHVLPGYPELVGIDVVGGAALLALITVRLHGRAAILSVKGHTDNRGEVRLSRKKTGQNTFSHALVYWCQP